MLDGPSNPPSVHKVSYILGVLSAHEVRKRVTSANAIFYEDAISENVVGVPYMGLQ